MIYFGLCLKLEISYRVIISLKDFGFFSEGFFFFNRLFLCMLKYLSFHNSSFALKILFHVKWQGHSMTHTPLVL